MQSKPLPPTKVSTLFWIKHIVPALVFAVFMLFLYPKTHLDTLITNLFFDAQSRSFPLEHQAFLSQWMHRGLKWLMVLIALSCLVLSAVSFKFIPLKAHRKSLFWVFVGMVTASTIVATLKHYNQHGCPWDIDLYGGNLPLFELFVTPPIGIEAGRCFPAGHPSGGFALIAFYFAFMASHPRFAKAMLVAGFVMGLMMGFSQMMRGAHFLSHVLWSGWVVWMTLVILFWLWPAHKNKLINNHNITH